MTALCFTGVTFRYLKYIFFTAGYSHRRLAFPDNLPALAADSAFPDSLPALAADPAFPDSLPESSADMDCNKSSDLSVYQILAVLAVDSQLAAMSADSDISVPPVYMQSSVPALYQTPADPAVDSQLAAMSVDSDISVLSVPPVYM